MCMSLAFSTAHFALCVADTRALGLSSDRELVAVSDAGGKLRPVPDGWAVGLGSSSAIEVAEPIIRTLGFTDRAALRTALAVAYQDAALRFLSIPGEQFSAKFVAVQRQRDNLSVFCLDSTGEGLQDPEGGPQDGPGLAINFPAVPDGTDPPIDPPTALQAYAAAAMQAPEHLTHAIRMASRLFYEFAARHPNMSAELEMVALLPGEDVSWYLRGQAAALCDLSDEAILDALQPVDPDAFEEYLRACARNRQQDFALCEATGQPYVAIGEREGDRAVEPVKASEADTAGVV